jgi:hypothetical protein
MKQRIADLERENARLLEGKFTKGEIHNICHNLHGTVSLEQFADGCAAEQIKLYGKCERQDLEHENAELKKTIQSRHQYIEANTKRLERELQEARAALRRISAGALYAKTIADDYFDFANREERKFQEVREALTACRMSADQQIETLRNRVTMASTECYEERKMRELAEAALKAVMSSFGYRAQEIAMDYFAKRDKDGQ